MNKHAKFSWNWKDTLALIIAAAPVALGAILFQSLPEQLATHYDMKGNIDGYMSKSGFISFMAALNIGLFILLKVAPFLNSKRNNYAKFLDVYELLRLVVSLLLSGVFVTILLGSVGYNVSTHMWLMLGMGIMWMVIGNFMGRMRTNYTMGVRTPWTMANKQVWNKTHRFAGPIWVLCGLIMAVCAFAGPSVLPYAIGITLLFSVVLPIVYSYLIFRRIDQREEE